ncbi:hypothetical protein Aph01nite_61420 [Acrocarpospora phusangensis]|uniref:Uncharacterized protein n=1 Tax=Acrocarpospora phusangensis TaxID=1070424 RepID=A0A919QF72_9ACTN|nr:hypothetical protein Aph01nite_61420 [Acrocarpospora phusangensis]
MSDSWGPLEGTVQVLGLSDGEFWERLESMVRAAGLRAPNRMTRGASASPLSGAVNAGDASRRTGAKSDRLHSVRGF